MKYCQYALGQCLMMCDIVYHYQGGVMCATDGESVRVKKNMKIIIRYNTIVFVYIAAISRRVSKVSVQLRYSVSLYYLYNVDLMS